MAVVPIITTIEAKCKDCYKCVRACPVKAIRIRLAESRPETATVGGRALHAEVVKERCILDGECLRVCPQKAKKVRLDAHRVRKWLEAGETVVASLAPSFAAAFGLDEPLRVVGALRALGFAAVEQTAVGAELVSLALRRELGDEDGAPGGPRPLITTSCPVVVKLMETTYPAAVRYASTVVSPMIAHGRALKRSRPGVRVVFVGPCVAKKDEAERPEVAGAVDAALTFEELSDWLVEEGLGLPGADPSEFDGYWPEVAPLFPVEGGAFRTAALPTDLLSGRWLAVSGMESCRELLAALSAAAPDSRASGLEGIRLVEMLACRGGCVAGPAMPEDGTSPAVRRQRLLGFVETRRKERAGRSGSGTGRPELPDADLHRTYRDRCPPREVPTEAEIREILARIGKTGPEDELNCGVCGYATCRDKAVAVHQGMAELDMCMPHMREMAESVSNLVIASSPFGVVAVDRDLRILDANGAFRAMFRMGHDEDLSGRPIGEIIDDATFRAVLRDRTTVETEAAYPDRGLLTQQTIFHLGKRDAVVGIFIDHTAAASQRQQLEELRSETVGRAREVISKQMKVAQEIAGLLGETTAETKVILTRLIDFMQKEGAATGGQG
ncbi:MAG: [Fe-Fe] hydrogenase large subunit C-terminal domain-containing protein [Bacillota bacterium]